MGGAYGNAYAKQHTGTKRNTIYEECFVITLIGMFCFVKCMIIFDKHNGISQRDSKGKIMI